MGWSGRLSLTLLLSISVMMCLITSTVSSHPTMENRKLLKYNMAWCESFKFATETHDAVKWEPVPKRCESFVKHYMTGVRYLSDSLAVAYESLAYAKTVKVAADGKDAWVFDVDDTLLSTLPYYAVHGYGTETFNETTYDAFTGMGELPVLPASLKLYNSLLKMGFKVFLLTGRDEDERPITVKNLLKAGYQNWAGLILRGASDKGTHAVVYKSKKRMELEAQGYRIQGCSGDQWSDLLGHPKATRLFKLPNPMYYIS